jgi:hypothetical protein
MRRDVGADEAKDPDETGPQRHDKNTDRPKGQLIDRPKKLADRQHRSVFRGRAKMLFESALSTA